MIGARVGHHTKIGNNVLLSGTTLAGSVVIGDGSFLGMNSSVIEGIRIEYNNLIGAGVFIKHNTKPNAVYRSPVNPALSLNSERVKLFR